jgi:predicted MFS family arabinose efflux permease
LVSACWGGWAGLWLIGSLSDRRDRLRLLALGLAAYGVSLATLTIVTELVLLGVWSLMIGASTGFRRRPADRHYR